MNIFDKFFQSKKSYDSNLKNELENFKKGLEKKDDYLIEFNKLKKIISNYFSKNYNVVYRFTFEDLKFDLKEKNLTIDETKKIDELCDFLNDMEFDLSKINKENILKAIDLFLDLNDINLKLITKLNDSNKLKNVSNNDIIQNTKIIDNIYTKDNMKKLDKDENLLPSFNLDIDADSNFNQQKINTHIKKEDNNFFNLEKNNYISNNDNYKNSNYKNINEEVVDFNYQNQLKNDSKNISKSKEYTIELNKNLKKSEISYNELNNKSKNLNKKEKISNLLKNQKKEQLKKTSRIKKGIKDIKNSLEKNKESLEEQILLIEKQQDLIKKEKKQLDKINFEEELPAFSLLKNNLDSKFDKLNNKKNELENQEKIIEEKIKKISLMEQTLKEKEEKIKKNELNLKEEKELLNKKEKLIESIKNELNSKYEHAIVEIKKLKEELIDKEKKFLYLQEFFNQRENKLSVEEQNLFEEKRKYSAFMSSLLKKHLDIAIFDLKNTDKRLLEIINKNKDLEKKLHDFEQKREDNINKLNELKNEINQKEKYFEKIEKEFKEKDELYNKLNEILETKEKNLLEKESALIQYENKVNLIDKEVKEKNKNIEIKEVDLKAIEKDIERLNFDLKNKNYRLEILKKHIEKRISSFERLKKDINNNINREKRQILRIERKLKRKGISIDVSLNNIELKENKLNYFKKNLNNLKLDENIEEVNIFSSDSFSNDYIGNPNILDILRLLNISRDFLRNNQKERARDAYLEIQRLFEELEEDEREEIYPEITEVFKAKEFGKILSNKYIETSINNLNIDSNDIQSLINQFEVYVETKDLDNAQSIYDLLQKKYITMSNEDKAKYYPQIMDVYNRLLDKEINIM